MSFNDNKNKVVDSTVSLYFAAGGGADDTSATSADNNDECHKNVITNMKTNSISAESQWNVMNMLKLIEEFRAQPVLWDPDHDSYKNKFSRNIAWDEIAENMKMNKLECEKKLNILRTQFRREYKRVQNLKCSRWFAFKAMLFLVNNEEKSSESINRGSKQYKKLQQEERTHRHENNITNPVMNKIAIDDIKRDESFDGSEIEDPLVQQYENENDECYEESNLYVTPSINNEEIIMNNIMTPIIGNGSGLKRKYDEGKTNYNRNVELYYKQNKNECSSFGEYIGYRLMRLPQRTRSIVMNAISNIVFEADMGKFDINNSS